MFKLKRSPGFRGINQVKKGVISKMVEDHKLMLHTLHGRSRLSGFRVEYFFKIFP